MWDQPEGLASKHFYLFPILPFIVGAIYCECLGIVVEHDLWGENQMCVTRRGETGTIVN